MTPSPHLGISGGAHTELMDGEQSSSHAHEYANTPTTRFGTPRPAYALDVRPPPQSEARFIPSLQCHMPTPPLSLYWCEMPDHFDDLFVVARNWRQARRYHADILGADPVDDHVSAERVIRIPDELQDSAEIGYAELDLVAKCGIKIHAEPDGQPGFTFNGRSWREGGVVPFMRVQVEDEIRQTFKENRTPVR